MTLWKELPGYFSFEDFYRGVAEEATFGESWHGVEVGVYAGKSAAFLASEIRRNRPANKVRLDLVDFFHGGIPERVLREYPDIVGAIHGACSWEAASLYPDQSLDFVFLDADHEYESIRKDIDAWLPKVKCGGHLAGHDFSPRFKGVVRAVLETFSYFEVFRGSKVEDDYFPVWSFIV